jgi:putative copper export protein
MLVPVGRSKCQLAEARHKLVKMLLLNYSIVTAVLLVVARSEKDIGNPGN